MRNAARSRGAQVADRAAEERDHPPPAAGQPVQVPGEVADHAVQREPRVVGRERVHRRPQRRRADVLGHVGRQAPRAAEGVEQQPGLLRRARAQLDEHVGPGDRGDLVDGAFEQRPFGARGVVLGQPGDLLEQLAAAGVVEPLRRQALRVRGETGPDVGRERGLGVVVGQVDVENACVHGLPSGVRWRLAGAGHHEVSVGDPGPAGVGVDRFGRDERDARRRRAPRGRGPRRWPRSWRRR